MTARDGYDRMISAMMDLVEEVLGIASRPQVDCDSTDRRGASWRYAGVRWPRLLILLTIARAAR